MKYCDEFGLRVLMGIVYETAPYWLEQAHPEARYVDARGRPIRLQGSQAQITGGWPGLCLDWEPVRQAAARFVRELVKVLAPHSSLYAYDCWNEPHIEPAWARDIWADPQEVLFCYCDKTVGDFRDWLRAKYGTLEALNDAWTRRYSDWMAIDAPRALGTYADWVDWRRFMIDRDTRKMKFRAESVQAVDDKHIVESHAAHHPPVDAAVASSTNGWRLAEVVDIWGLSLFPRWQVADIYRAAANFEITRSNAAGGSGGIELLQAIVTSVVPPPVTSEKVRPRLIQGERRSPLAIFNDGSEDHAGLIQLPSNFRRAANLHRQAEIPIERNAIRVTVPFQDVVELLLD